MRIGLFFGTYNPVHAGHMIIAGYFAEFSDLEQVWMVVTPHNPHKPAGSLLQDHHRFEMVRIAIGDYKKLKASKVEFGLPKPSYTIYTLLHLEEQYPEHEFSLIMGSDNLAGFRKWKSWEQIIEKHKLYVYPRPGSDGGDMKDHDQVVFVNAPLIQLSSTFIRDAVKDRKDIRYMMPASAYEYMDEMNFYKK